MLGRGIQAGGTVEVAGRDGAYVERVIIYVIREYLEMQSAKYQVQNENRCGV